MVKKEENVLMRKFGNIAINWQISRFYFEPTREGFLISSPEFCVDGLYATKWKMTLNPKMSQKGEYHFSISLERLKSNPGPDSVSVSLKVWLIDYKNEECSTVRYCSNFENNHPHVITLESVNSIHESVKPTTNPTGTFIISCHLLVNFEDSYKSIHVPTDTGLKSLSDDLLNLYKVGTDYDIILRINGKDIYAHKVVVCPRSLVLANIIETKSKDMVVDLSDLDYESVKNIVAYMYSGNIDYIARNASVIMYETAVFLKLPYVADYFNPHNLYLRSEIDARTRTFSWAIKYWTQIPGNCMLSPLFVVDDMDTTWRLRLYTKGVDNSDKYLSIFADVVKGTKPENCCFRFAITDDNADIWSEKRQLSSDSNERIGFENFISKEYFQSKLEQSDSKTLHVIFRLDVQNDDVFSTDSYTLNYGALPAHHFYWCLSSEMTFSLERATYADVTLKAEGVSFEAAKCILSARSPVLKSMLNQVSDENSIVLDMPSNVLKIILYYIYSSICDSFAENEILDIYKAAKDLSLLDLKEKCSNNLKNYLCVDSVCDILTFSHEQEDLELKTSALNFISKNRGKVFEDSSWKNLEVKNPLLYTEVTKFLKNM